MFDWDRLPPGARLVEEGQALSGVPRNTAAEGDWLRDAAPALLAHGFLPLVPQSRPRSDDQRLHRHLALIVGTREQRAPAAAWVKALARVSPRSHLVCLAPGAGTPARGPALVAAGNDAGDDRRLEQLVGGGQFEQAEAWLAALHAEARLLGGTVRARTRALEVWLLVRQARFEEAQAACRDVPGPLARALARFVAGAIHGGASARLDGWPAPRRGMERRRPDDSLISAPPPGRKGRTDRMYVMHAVPEVLQLITDAEDELAALRAAVVWARRHAGADAVAFVGGEHGRVLCAEGWGSAGPPVAECLRAVRTSVLERVVHADRVWIAAPVRCAGARVGGLLLIGPLARTETLAEAAAVLSAMCASAVRVRLDVVAGSVRGGRLLPEILGQGPAIVALRETIARSAVVPFPVLVEGESGTGKELVARALHRLSARRDRRFAAINCAALSDDLVEAELFGHTRGAFTGAVGPRAGLFEDAHGGTLFLDEVAELSARAQAKLLRVLQEREIRRVGENAPRPVDVRVIAATNRPLADVSAQGGFRHDLLFRLAVVRIRLPPLRERAEDVALLAQAFWRRSAAEAGTRAMLGADALARLASHGWPGNVRELQNVMAGLAVLAPARGRVAARLVDRVLADAGATRQSPPMSLERARWLCEQRTIAAALARHAGRRTAAARELGLTRQGLTKAIRRLQLGEEVVQGVA